jgi:hypothetical protein
MYGLSSKLVCLFFQVNVLTQARGLYYKPMMIINDNYRVLNKLETSINDNARVVFYDRHMFILQATKDAHSLQKMSFFYILQIHNVL